MLPAKAEAEDKKLGGMVDMDDQDIEAIREVVKEMERGGVKGNISTVNIVIGAMGGVEGVEMGMRLARV
ncbi:hypothetical protein Droror1_Dr00027947 [Drosera rotundifolia]